MSVEQERLNQVVDFDLLVEKFPPPSTFFASTWTFEPNQITRLQSDRLRFELDRASQNPFFAGNWAEAGFDHRSVQTIEDLKDVPIYDVEAIRASIVAAPPYGQHQSWMVERGLDAGSRVFFSDGTTGKARPTINTAWDVEVLGILAARAYWLVGLRPGDLVMNAWTYGTHAACSFADHGAKWCGCPQITASSGAVTPSVKQIELAREYGVKSILTFGSHLLNLADVAASQGLDPKTDFDIKVFPGPSGGIGSKIADAWGVNAYESYGFNEVAYAAMECPARGGLHINEDAFIFEIIDSETGEPLPDGQTGDIVVTSLFRTGNSMIRFNSRDISALQPRGQCECGSWMRKIDYFGGRSDNMVKLRGNNIWPEAIGKVIADDERTNGEYFCWLESDGRREEMTVRVESYLESSRHDELQEDLMTALRIQLGVRILVEVAPVGGVDELTRGGAKKKRFEDRRNES